MNNDDLEAVRNHDYTISIRDKKGREIKFRDITGGDLEYLDMLFESTEGDGDEKRQISFSGIQKILDLLSVEGINSGRFTQRTTVKVFSCIKEHILCNYMSKYSWLKTCYGIQNGSFMNIEDMEKVPMTKFIAMAQIHKEAMDSIKND